MTNAFLKLATTLVLLLPCINFAIAQPQTEVYNCKYDGFDNALRAGYSRLNEPPIYTNFKIEGNTLYAREDYRRPDWAVFGSVVGGKEIQGIDADSHGTFTNLQKKTFDLNYLAQYSIDLQTGKAKVEVIIRGAPGGTWRGNMTGTCLTDSQAAAIEARRTASRTPDEAQAFLLGLLKGKTAHFQIGNVIDQSFGALPKIAATETSYRRKFLRGWVEYRSSQADYIVQLEISNFESVNPQGMQDACTTSARSIVVKGARGGFSGGSFDFPTDPLVKEMQYSEDSKWIYTLHTDPKPMFNGSYSIDWRRSTFVRTNNASPGWTRFDVSTPNRVPYASIGVTDKLADDVESAIRSLQSVCKGRS